MRNSFDALLEGTRPACCRLAPHDGMSCAVASVQGIHFHAWMRHDIQPHPLNCMCTECEGKGRP